MTIISFQFGEDAVFMVVKDKDDMVFDKIKEFQEMGLRISLIHLHASTHHVFAQKRNIMISENQFEGPDSMEKIMKIFVDLGSQRIHGGLQPRQGIETHTNRYRTGARCQVSALVSALVDKPDTVIAARRINYSKYPRETVALADVLPFLPNTGYIIFTALGSYQDTYRFLTILETFQTFVREYQYIHYKTMVLVLGGEYNHEKDYQRLRDIRQNYTQLPNSIVYFKQNLSIPEKKTILKHSTIEFDYKEGIENASNIRMGFMAGVPLLSAPQSYSWQFMLNACFGYYVHFIHEYKKSAKLMQNIVLNATWMAHKVRQYNITFLSRTYRVLQEFDEEDRLFQNP